MNTRTVRRKVLIFGICLLLGLVLIPAQAQGQNLLTNPGFEKPFVTLDGTPPRQVAQGWSPWNLGGGQSASENVQPEYYPASDVTDGLGVPRIRSGSDAQQYHSFFATHDGGLYQRVTGITAGTQLRFSAYVYVWSSTFDDVNKSEGDGGVVVMVGIDPTGGTSGDSSNILWSQASVQYDAYNEYTVTATASQTAVTVFVRTTVSTPVKNNNIYVDDAALTAVTAAVPTATATATLTKTNPPPTATNTLVPSSTSVSPVATDLGIVPTDTTVPSQTPPPVPTNTRAPTVTPTFTLVPPTAVPTSVPTEVPTQEIQLPTSTVVVATAIPVPTATATLFAGEFAGKVIHNVQPNDTVGQIASLYGSSIDAIIEANGLNASALIHVGQALVIPVKLAAPATSTPTITPVIPPTSAPPPTTTYIVQPGDTLFRLAARFNTTATTLAQLNGITNPNIIRVGQRLVIPTGGQVVVPPTPVVSAPTSAPPSQPVTYVVQPGDTLFRIALRFRVSMGSLAKANNISNLNLVFVGQVLVIP
jgi:LysM repeat protein